MNEGIYPVDQVGDKLASLRRVIFGSELDYVGQGNRIYLI
jgi:hypothetical protein